MKTLKYLLAALLSLSLISCTSGGNGDSNNSSGDTTVCLSLGRIINGQICQNTKSPVVKINLLLGSGQGALCSGTVIDSDKVLTAAHCFVLDPVVSASVEANGKPINATRVWVHPQVSVDGVNLAVFNDVAVLELEEDLNLPTMPILTSQTIVPGDAISIQGFGLDENDNSGTNKGGTMTVTEVTPNHIFAFFNGKGQNSCFGDSGGPAFRTIEVNGVSFVGIVGVVSSGNPETGCDKGDTTLFANLQNSVMFDFVASVAPGLQTL